MVSEVKEVIDLDSIANKTIAVDAYNTIYQFLSIIRQPDGTPLTDSKGRVTSHLSGLFYRTANLLDYGITPVFVFDGIPPIQKRKTIEARMNRRKIALEEWSRAKEQGLEAEARTHAMASTRITKEVVASAKELLDYTGIAYYQAPSEGEAQAARFVANGFAYGLASQDYDSFLFGADVVLRNITISGKRKLPGKDVYIVSKPERILLKDILEKFAISRKQLIWIGMLVGTDFNEGVEKVGPKTAMKIVKGKKDVNEVAAYVKEKYGVEMDEPETIESIFYKPDINEMQRGQFEALLKKEPDREKLMHFMCDEYEFSSERIEKFAEKFTQFKSQKRQKGINSWM